MDEFISKFTSTILAHCVIISESQTRRGFCPHYYILLKAKQCLIKKTSKQRAGIKTLFIR